MRTWQVAGLLTGIACTTEGAAGPPGANGRDGFAALTRLVPEPEGTNCPNGGTAVQVGVDANGDGSFGDAERTSTAYVCNGADGTSGTNGSNGTNGVGALRVVDDAGIELGILVKLEGSTVLFQNPAGDIWNINSFTGAYSNADFLFTTADCSGTAYQFPTIVGNVYKNGTRAHRYVGAAPAMTTFGSILSAAGGCSTPGVPTRSDLAPYEDAGVPPAAATPPIRLVP